MASQKVMLNGLFRVTEEAIIRHAFVIYLREEGRLYAFLVGCSIL
jgi:hypothetical protein